MEIILHYVLTSQFPLIKLAKKLKGNEEVESHCGRVLEAFPLIKLAKKLKASTATGPVLLYKFPLIKLAKKLKVV